MILESTIEACYPLSEVLVSKKKLVRAIDSTPVSNLIKAGSYKVPASNNGLIEEDMSEMILSGSREMDADGRNRHDETMTELTDVISKTIRNNLNIARNVVNPLTKEVIEDTELYINQMAETRLTHIKINPVYLGAVYDNPSLPSMVERFKSTAINDIALTQAIPVDTSRENIFNLAKTGMSDFDSSLQEFCQKFDQGGISFIYNSIFGDATQRSPSLLNTIRVDNPNGALIIHLVSKGLMENIPEGINMSLSEYKAYVSEIMSVSGRIVLGVIEGREREIQTKQLIKPYPPVRNLGLRMVTIDVNGYLYERWLEDGGTPEAIFGDFVGDQKKGYQQLIDNKDALEKLWGNTQRVLSTKARMEKFNDASEGLKVSIAKQINELDEDMLIVSRDVMHSKLEEKISQLYGNFYDELPVYARKIVCEVIFPHTDAHKILCAIDNVARDFKNIDIKEAALLATIEYVTEWVSSQYIVEESM